MLDIKLRCNVYLFVIEIVHHLRLQSLKLLYCTLFITSVGPAEGLRRFSQTGLKIHIPRSHTLLLLPFGLDVTVQYYRTVICDAQKRFAIYVSNSNCYYCAYKQIREATEFMSWGGDF